VVLLWLISSVLLCYNMSSNQNMFANKNEPVMNSTKQQDTILLEDHFTEEQYAQWKEFLRNWQRSSYAEILSKEKFSQDCIDCGSILLKLELSLDKNGKCTDMALLESIIDCSRRSVPERKKLETLLLNNIRTLSFPEFLRNQKVHVRMGKATKC
jgi:hypothetical protein